MKFKKIALFPLFLLILTAFLYSHPGKDVYNGARGVSLNAGWRFNRGDVSGAQATGFNDAAWRSLDVPHDWSVELNFNQSSAAGGGGGYLDGGIGWYRKSFTLAAGDSGKRVFVAFDGVYMNAEVFINGTALGVRPYGYATFSYEITSNVTFGGTANILAVKVNNNQPNSRWYSGSGIYRNVWLTLLDPVHVAYCGTFVRTPSVSGGSATVSISTRVQNQSGSAKSVYVNTVLLNASGSQVAGGSTSAVSIGTENTFEQSFTVSNPTLWSVDNPYLYSVKTLVYSGSTVTDTYITPLGIRYFNFDANNGFSLNGVSMKLKGVCMHHDLGSLGAAVNYRALERQMQIMKTMGCNAIRTSHNFPAPELLEICDRLGLLVMDEAFDCWESSKTSNDYGKFFASWAQTDIREWVLRDRNHPSVIMWSIGNEIGSASTGTATNLKNWITAQDTTRPVSWGSNSMSNSTYQTIAGSLDLQGYNYGWSLYDSHHSSHPTWKIYGSETSSAVRSRGIYKTPTTSNILSGSDNQCSSYDNSVVSWGHSAEVSWNATKTRAFVSGEFIWTGFDYIGEPTPYGWPAKSSYFGIVDTAGFPKDIYYFYQSQWTTAPMVYILPHWNWTSGSTIPVWVYSNCDSVELFLNNASLGSKTVGSSYHLEWSVAWASGTLRAEAKKNGSVVTTREMKTAGTAARLQLTADRTSILADGIDQSFITVDVVDANGNIVPSAANNVTFSVSGNGKLVGVDNGNAPSTESYKGTQRMAFSGKCLAIVQSTGAAGAITISAGASGLTGASVTVNATTDNSHPTGTPVVTPTATPGTVRRGDANNNGTVDIVDALMIAQYSVGLNPAGFVVANGDCNCSGGIDIVDALIAAQFYVGLLTSMPC